MPPTQSPFGMLVKAPQSELANLVVRLGLIGMFAVVYWLAVEGMLRDPPVGTTLVVGALLLVFIALYRNAREEFFSRMARAARLAAAQEFQQAVALLELPVKGLRSPSFKTVAAINLALVKLRMGLVDEALTLLEPVEGRSSWLMRPELGLLRNLGVGLASTFRGDPEGAQRGLDETDRRMMIPLTRPQTWPLRAYYLLAKAFQLARFGDEQSSHDLLKEHWDGLTGGLDPLCQQEARLLLAFLCARLEVDHGELGIGPALKASYFSVMTSSWPELSAFVEESSKSHQTTTT